MTYELKPCPYCFGPVELGRALHDYDKWGVWCPHCNPLSKAVYDSKEEAAAAWNGRLAVDPRDVAMALRDGELWQRVRECEMVQDPDYDLVTCSYCGYEEERNILVAPGGIVTYDGNFCPQCGGRVKEGR